ncbi:hypothetical protein DV737_g1697, partial [Chaetothyriales sp. CBS 132003]
MPASTFPSSLASLCLLACTLLFGSAQAASSVNVALKASFNSAPLLVELLETAAAENGSSYFPLLDRIADGVFAESSTDKELYDQFVHVLREEGHVQSPEALSSFKLAFSLHASAPRVQAHFQYYNRTISPHLPAAQDAVCPAWVQLDGQQYCTPTLERAQQSLSLDEAEEVLPFDRVLGPEHGVPSAILYADISNPLFPEFHKAISASAKAGESAYRLRYRRSPGEHKPLYLSGYGAELSLKRTDYIVIDDRDAPKSEDLSQAALKAPSDAEEVEIKPLTTSELANLGLNTASYIASNQDPLQALVQVTANFPKYSSFLASQNASTSFLNEHQANRKLLLPAGYNILWINGLQIEPRQVNAYSLLDHLRRERKLIEEMKTIGLTATDAIGLLSSDVIAQAQAHEVVQRYDWRDEPEGGNVIIWLNDLEKDKRYAKWPKYLAGLFQRSRPGQLPPVARDIHNLIVPFDIENIKDIELVARNLQSLIKGQVPIRIGLIPSGSTQTAETYARLSHYLVDTYGLSSLIAFYDDLLKSKRISSNAEKHLATAIKDTEVREGKQALTYNQVLQSEALGEYVSKAQEYLDRLELSTIDPHFIINGVVLPRGETWFELLSSRVFLDLQQIQQAVYQDALEEDTWVPHFFLFQAIARRNSLIVPSDSKDVNLVDVPALTAAHPDAFAQLPKSDGEHATLLSDRAHLLLVTDLDSQDGRELLASALEFKAARSEVELLVVHNGGDGTTPGLSEHFNDFWAAYKQQAKDLTSEDLRQLIQQYADILTGNHAATPATAKLWEHGKGLIRDLGLEAGQNALWLNGRLIGPLPRPFTLPDLLLLLDFERSSRIAPVTTAITGLGLEERFTNALDLAKITSTVARSHKSELPEGLQDAAPLIRIDRFKAWNDTYTAIQKEPAIDALVQVVAVVDPVSEVGQSWAPILKTLCELDGVNTKIFLNPKSSLSELPVKRFYRQVLSSAPAFNQDGSLQAPGAAFTKLPLDTLFNLGMVVPPSWLVSPEEANADPDNIKFNVAGNDADADVVYKLDNILIEGHARDVTAGPPPRGVQLLLGTTEQAHVTDTIIMANLGYFQFKANPGFWKISLKPGRSSKIFHIDSVGPNGYSAQPGDATSSVAVLSFDGLTLFPRLSRRPGMEDEDVLEESSSKGQVAKIVNKGASFLSSLGLTKDTKTQSTNAEINIFSVASGHLYERMLSIMLVSVMRHTTHTVKFWFIEQFLSPSFKSTLPILAEHYNFEYEMVTYKWPHWLRGQREKQREIWGYKILFLDVLFPVDLDKVIFVDADQIVRTDMIDLTRVDLHGAPYGFTPMCDSRTEMEGFRFWKQGYWSTYLRGKPYHISALYVVDLKTFRALAAGDRLRGQYQALSADPASLSNLDQDLPNHLQHSLPIFSLDQNWLWCETWCSDEALTTAKTIDLCNNPQTKEPKLDRARRQVPEWTVYDEEIAAVVRDAREKTTEKESQAAAAVDSDERGLSQQVAVLGRDWTHSHLLKQPKPGILLDDGIKASAQHLALHIVDVGEEDEE